MQVTSHLGFKCYGFQPFKRSKQVAPTIIKFKDLVFLSCFTCSRAFTADRRKQIVYDKGSISTNIFDC
jgi:hypothetical protein